MRKKMKLNNTNELIGKEVCDANGNSIGKIDKIWTSWDQEYPGHFFGINPNDDARNTHFRGTNKLIPIYSDYIRDVTDHITLNKTIEELGRFWNKTVPCGQGNYPTDKMVDMPIYDKNHSRVGTFFAWVESDGTYKNYGVFVDPYVCDTFKVPYNILMPIPTNYITDIKDTICLDKTLDELKEYWNSHCDF